MGAPEGNTNSVFSKIKTICWDCANAVPDGKHGCSWSMCLKPVDGWVAKETNGLQGSYRVIECPKFERG